jgi:hypothetical protein
MKKRMILTSVASVALAAAFSAHAQTTVTELLFNADGTSSDQYPTTSTAIASPVTVTSGFGPSSPAAANYLSGLGTLQYTVTGAGAHYFDAMIDDEADYKNGVFNDSGAIINPASAPGYLSWEIGNPDTDTPGTIKANTKANSLADANDVLSGNTDIAVALGFNFTLAANQTATIDITASDVAPQSGFYIEQENVYDTDPFFYGDLTISSNTVPGLPDNGATWSFMLLALTGLAGVMKIEHKFFPKKG